MGRHFERGIFSGFLVLALSLSSIQSFALSERKIGDISLFDKIKQSGISELALHRAFTYIDTNENKPIQVKVQGKPKTLTIKNLNFLTIADFTLPSSQRRLYFIDLNTGTVEKYYVAHGLGSGGDLPTAFSNIDESKQSSLGIYLTGDTYMGDNGNSLLLYGLEPSNSNAFERSIVVHGADYVSLEFLAENKRLGRSFGCPAVSPAIAADIIPKIKGGAIYYIHHDILMDQALKTPNKQVLAPAPTTAPKPVATTQPPKPVVPPVTTPQKPVTPIKPTSVPTPIKTTVSSGPSIPTPSTPAAAVPKTVVTQGPPGSLNLPVMDSEDSSPAQPTMAQTDDDNTPPVPLDNPPPTPEEENQK